MNRREAFAAVTSAALAAVGSSTFADERASAETIARLRTFGGIGKERPILEAGKEVELFRHEGAGCLTHMWFAMDVRSRIRVYVDGEAEPSIDMALNFGHGFSHGGPPAPWGIPQFGRTGGIYNTYRIPFQTSIRVSVIPSTAVFDTITGQRRGGSSAAPRGSRFPSAARHCRRPLGCVFIGWRVSARSPWKNLRCAMFTARARFTR